jgi:hypothetical protein
MLMPTGHSHRQVVVVVLSNSGVVENAHVMSIGLGPSSVKNRGNRIFIECLQNCVCFHGVIICKPLQLKKTDNAKSKNNIGEGFCSPSRPGSIATCTFK